MVATTHETRIILSSEAKTHLARLLDDVFANRTRYIIQRFNTPRAVLISLADFKALLAAEGQEVSALRESDGEYQVGRSTSESEVQSLLYPAETDSDS